MARALAESFGSVEEWRTTFQAIGGLRGVGWVLLCEDPMTGRLSNHWVTLHQDERGRYLDAFFRNIDWAIVERRLVEPMAIRSAAA